MIKNLLNADEDPPPGTKVVIEDSAAGSPAESPSPEKETTAENFETRPAFEIPEDAKFFSKPDESVDDSDVDEDRESLSALIAELEHLEPEEFDRLEEELKTMPSATGEVEKSDPLPEPVGDAPAVPPVETVAPASDPARAESAGQATETADNFPTGTLFQTGEPKPSMAETIRQSGLAYSAAIVLFGSIVFTMILGWFADLLLGTSPWGIVGGIVLGAIIGFIQFFRITAQIFKK